MAMNNRSNMQQKPKQLPKNIIPTTAHNNSLIILKLPNLSYKLSNLQLMIQYPLNIGR